MALIRCQMCNEKINDTVTSCPNCGKHITENDIFVAKILKKQSILLTCAKLTIYFMIFGFFVLLIFDPSDFKNLISSSKSQEINGKNLTVSSISQKFSKKKTISSAFQFQGVNYTIIKKRHFGNIKATIDIRLERKVSEDFLKKLASKIREDEPKKFDRIFLSYYLPNMTYGAGAWATTHFETNLKVKILGTTIKEEGILLNEPKKILYDEIIGEWFDDSPYVAGKYTFIKKSGKIFMIRKLNKGRKKGTKIEMIQKNQSGRIRFEEKKKRNDSGEYYLIEKNGNMSVYDNAGHIFTMRSIK